MIQRTRPARTVLLMVTAIIGSYGFGNSHEFKSARNGFGVLLTCHGGIISF
jgi:hypothetical protein